ncbi:hypothetical protein [Actinoplanes sp. NPDC020271]|uniref:hypothetical protein n=1 Tax=Actinoplanes sp. NPDC020271 TaxID=3363896 RepID=UPI003790EB0A
MAAVCHGPAALIGLTRSGGTPPAAGKRVAGFTDGEEAAAGLTEVVPFLLQSTLEKRGGEHSGAPGRQPDVVADGRLGTGQNPASSAGVAEEVLKVLSTSKR